MNFFSATAVVFSVFVWGWMTFDFLKLDMSLGEFFNQSRVRVQGVKSDRQQKDSLEKENMTKEKGPLSALTVGDLLPRIVDAPEKKDPGANFFSQAHSAVAIDADSGTILHNQNGTKRMAIASLTKVMTAILVVENIRNLDEEIITIDQEAFSVDGTTVGCPTSVNCDSNRMTVGEKVTARDLLEAMLIASTNDAAVALAKHVAGSQEHFAEIMNDKAASLGLENTNFCNPSGLDKEGDPGACYSTAYDFARIAAYSLRYDVIWNALRMKEKSFLGEGGNLEHKVASTNLLLDTMPNCLGSKTGFTYEAGRSLMTVAHHPLKQKVKVVSVMLDNPYRWQEMPELFNWCFNNYSWK